MQRRGHCAADAQRRSAQCADATILEITSESRSKGSVALTERHHTTINQHHLKRPKTTAHKLCHIDSCCAEPKRKYEPRWHINGSVDALLSIAKILHINVLLRSTRGGIREAFNDSGFNQQKRKDAEYETGKMAKSPYMGSPPGIVSWRAAVHFSLLPGCIWYGVSAS